MCVVCNNSLQSSKSIFKSGDSVPEALYFPV